jgi:alpha-ketoglutarate-dependent taurine dioxygenase
MSAFAAQSTVVSPALKVIPQQPRIGAEVGGLDLREPLQPHFRNELLKLLVQYKVLFFRDQDITREQHIAFGRQFGDLTVHPVLHSADSGLIIQPISADRFREYRRSADGQKDYSQEWHSDETFRAVPPLASILRAIEVPELGGDTAFANAAAAYEGLSGEVKKRIEGLRAVHQFLQRNRNYLSSERRAEIERENPPVEHPVVRVHPDSGVKVLFVNPTFTTHIVGLDKDESDRLLAHLFYEISRPEYQVRFKWRKGSIAFWDNRATQHYAVWDYGDAKRELERVTIKGQPL